MHVAPLIMCFGDSLTAGFQSPAPDNPTGMGTPYGDFLQEHLGSRGRVSVSGICGETTGEMAMRFRQDVVARRPAYVVLLGGTNDLGWNADPAEIRRNLIKMYGSALAADIVPVPVTVPSIRFDAAPGETEKRWLEDAVGRRLVLNRFIEEYAESKRLKWIDLFGATAEQPSRQLAAPYSNDGLHLTTAGYRLFARLLYDRIFAEALASSEGTHHP